MTYVQCFRTRRVQNASVAKNVGHAVALHYTCTLARGSLASSFEITYQILFESIKRVAEAPTLRRLSNIHLNCKFCIIAALPCRCATPAPVLALP